MRLSTYRYAFLASLAVLGWSFLIPVSARAVRPTPSQLSDVKRFHLDRSSETVWKSPSSADLAAKQAFLRSYGAGAGVFYHPRTGAPGLVTGFRAAAKIRDPEAAARRFVDDHRDFLKIKSKDLRLALKRGAAHLLFAQSHLGLPVEFSRIGVHFNRSGEIDYLSSNYDPAITASAVPAVGEEAARAAVSRDLGAPVRARGQLVFFPDDRTGETRLAWKFRFGSRQVQGLWVYYVDASNGTVLLRYDDLRYQTFVTSGTILGGVFPLNPQVDPGGKPVLAPMPNLQVWIVDSSSSTLTKQNGFYSFGMTGRVFTALQGPYAVVRNEDVPNASYDNGAGLWFGFTTPLASPNFPDPYPPDADLRQTITGPAEALKMRVHFKKFDVGASTEYSFDDDELQMLDSTGRVISSYIGENRGPFMSGDVVGRSLTLRLTSNDSSEGNGYNVDISSFFKFTVADPTSAAVPRTSYDIVFTTNTTQDHTWDEMNAYYQIDKMHEYFAKFNDPPHFPLSVDYAMPVMVHHSANYRNAFYNPANRNIFFGDGLPRSCPLLDSSIIDCSYALDTTVVRHEYAHFAVGEIYPLDNFGQTGAISECLSDYFSGSSLDYPKIGEFVQGGLEPLRNLDDGIGDGLVSSKMCTANCRRLPDNWTGEIYADSLILSQALWDVRQVVGAARADELVFKSLYYFPESFREFREAVLKVDQEYYPSGPNHALIEQAFTVHGISSTIPSGDPNEPNDGPQKATDASVSPTWSGTVYPAGDQDYFAINAGVGEVRAVLTLPALAAPGEYMAFGLRLSNLESGTLDYVMPTPTNGTGPLSCPDSGDCISDESTVTLSYRNETPGLLYVSVACGRNDYGSNARCASMTPYTLTLSQNPDNPLAGKGVVATQENDIISCSLPMTAFVNGAKTIWSFSHARLRDQSLVPMTETDTLGGAVALIILDAPTVNGNIMTGRFRVDPRTAARYPAVGTVYLEIFGVNKFGTVMPLGLSPAVALGPSQGSFSAWNNVFNPMKGEKATLRATLSAVGHVTIRLFTLTGDRVATLVDRTAAGSVSVDWDGRNEAGHVVASGVYLAHVKGPGINKTKKIVVVK